MQSRESKNYQKIKKAFRRKTSWQYGEWATRVTSLYVISAPDGKSREVVGDIGCVRVALAMVEKNSEPFTEYLKLEPQDIALSDSLPAS